VDRLRRALIARRDELLAAALFAFGLAELMLSETYQGRAAWPGPWWAGLAQVCLLTVPLAWRRRAPLASSLTILAAVAVSSLLWGAAESTAAFLSILVTVFSGTAYARQPRLVVVAAVASLAVHNLRDPSVATVVDWFWSAGFLVVAVLLGAAVRSRQLRIVSLQEDAETLSREYDERVAAATAAERAAIARELHDVVAHAVSVIVIQAQAGSRAVEDDDPTTAHGLLDTIESTGRSALADLRRLLRLLSTEDTPVDPSPGLAHLDSLVDGFEATGLQVSLSVPHPLPTLSGAADLAVYRLVQEALTNTLRHAEATQVVVDVTARSRVLDVVVEDDGHSRATPTTDGTGRGLIGMRERVTMAGGSLLETQPTGHGFRVRAQLPLEDADHTALEVTS
jgi:signal transduction histidine kinase